MRATQGIFEGTIYFEVNLLTKRLEDQKENVKSSSSKNSPPSFAPQKDGVPHWRIGICQYQTDLLQPIGVDETSYALGFLKFQKFSIFFVKTQFSFLKFQKLHNFFNFLAKNSAIIQFLLKKTHKQRL